MIELHLRFESNSKRFSVLLLYYNIKIEIHLIMQLYF